jgi:S-adenosylmethionine:tRNA ribosyltransferase-isomerase
MLISAFYGFDDVRAAYQHALSHHYRFFSYGDACLLACRTNGDKDG